MYFSSKKERLKFVLAIVGLVSFHPDVSSSRTITLELFYFIKIIFLRAADIRFSCRESVPICSSRVS